MAEVVVVANPNDAGSLVADVIVSLVQAKPGAVLSLATGSSPLSVYESLANRVRAGSLDLGRTRAFALDEYLGLPPTHPASYRRVIDREVVESLGMDPSLVRVPDGDLGRAASAGMAYEREIAEAGGVDLQLLGIGTTGHIGFNEPGSSIASRTRVKMLTERTRVDNARFFNDPAGVPTHCITQGVGTILEARNLVLLAFGAAKANAIAAAVEGRHRERTRLGDPAPSTHDSRRRRGCRIPAGRPRILLRRLAQSAGEVAPVTSARGVRLNISQNPEIQ